MGGEQADGVMAIITEAKWASMGKQMKDSDQQMLALMKQQIVDQFDKESDAFAASARLFDDGIIDPRDTRKVLGLTLSVCREAQRREVRGNTFGVARL